MKAAPDNFFAREYPKLVRDAIPDIIMLSKVEKPE
jgi:predicted house-cleaning noncanonical NTP pyrophosphatase (MazG superfamily)